MEELTILGPVEAWRFWRIGFYQTPNPAGLLPRLHSFTYAGYCWPPREAADSSWGHRNVCLYLSHFMKERESTTLKKREFSTFSCDCGIYGWQDADDALVELETYRSTVLGKTALWGRGIRSEAGYRTEYGYPLFLSGAVCALCGKLAPIQDTIIIGEKAAPAVYYSIPVLNYRIICRTHRINELEEEKAASGWYNKLLEEYGISIS